MSAVPDLFSLEFERDPFPTYSELRKNEPAKLVPLPDGRRAWFLTRYEDARAALADPRLSSDTRRHGALDAFTLVPEETRHAMTSHMVNADAPEHTRLRRLVAKVFTPRRIAAMRPAVEQTAIDLLDALEDRDEPDLVAHYAFLLSAQVLCLLLGIPSEERDRFRETSATIVAGRLAADRFPAAAAEMHAYTRALLDRKTVAPGDDLLSELIQVHDGSDQLSEDELSSMVFMFLIAGQETSANLIGTCIYLLMSRPYLYDRIRTDEQVRAALIEEALRYESPVEMASYRFATEPLEIAGQKIEAGDIVVVALNSANRDETRFHEADTFDVERRKDGHLAFGHGIHFCLGAQLAKLEVDVALAAMSSRFAVPELRGEADRLLWRIGVMRGLESLPVTLRRR